LEEVLTFGETSFALPSDFFSLGFFTVSSTAASCDWFWDLAGSLLS
jgi:hypothetical protein